MAIVWWRIYREESLRGIICKNVMEVVSGLFLKRKKETIVFLFSKRFLNQDWEGIVGEMYLYQIAKLGGRWLHWLSHILLMQDLK